MKIQNMQVNHLMNPLGFRMTRVLFTWKVTGARGKQQSWARVQIAYDQEMKHLLFDSGEDKQADSLGYEVKMTLAPYTRYYWRVSVCTDYGETAEGEVQWFETAKGAEEWIGKWITCDSIQKRHPFFEKKVHPKKRVEKARLYICGLGLYEVYYNEQRIGEEYLTPYSNDYNEWIQYQTYDVTRELQLEGTLSVLLGNGWYKGRFGFQSHEDKGYYGDEWKLIAELHLTYDDGTKDVIATDDSWQVRRSKITFSNLYDGEHRDDTLEELPREQAAWCEKPKGKLTERMSLPVIIHEVLEPEKLLITPTGEKVFDLGQEFAGIFSLRVQEPKGTVIRIQTGEILQNGNFYNENLRSAKSEYVYVSDGHEHRIIPHFTYYGYRYVKVQGISNPRKEDFKGLVLYSDIAATGKMETGHELVNRLIENIRWGLQSNFLDVPTDCPQRDERMGWTGDTQVFSPTATYLKDTYAFYAKYLYDLGKEQSVKNGKVPDVIPSCGVELSSSVWGDASCIIPWNLYLFYGDKSILEDQFESMCAWVDYIRREDGNDHGWRRLFHYGDWLALDNPTGDKDQMFGGTDEGFIADIYYANSADIVSKAASVLGKEKEEKEYRELASHQFEVVRNEYYSMTGRCCFKTQTSLLLTLKYHLSKNETFIREELRRLFADSHGKLRTGFVGTPLMCNILSEHDMSDIAYDLLLNEEYPGWLHEVKLGATTVWERWNSVLDDGSISDTGMNSLNHYSYGSILEWMFRYAAGINPQEEVPGMREISLNPTLNWNLRKMDASYDSPAGMYRCKWELEDAEYVTLFVSVPFGCSAVLQLPLAGEEVYRENDNPMFAEVRDGKCYLTAGEYQVSYHLTESLIRTVNIDTPLWKLPQGKIMKLVCEALSVDSIPEQYMSYSIRELAALSGGNISEEQLNVFDTQIAQML